MESKAYLNMKKSPEYLALMQYYTRLTTLDILGVARYEPAHSAFLAWLLDSSGSHGLGDFGIRKLYEAVCVAPFPFNNGKTVPDLSPCRLGRVAVSTEQPLGSSGRADVVAAFEADGNKHLLFIENKVKSSEGDGQTAKYAAFLKKKSGEVFQTLYGGETPENSAVTVLCVYLNAFPSADIIAKVKNAVPADENHFLVLNYQYLLEYMLEPCRAFCSVKREQERIADYIRCLGQQRRFFESEGSHDESMIMAVSDTEKKMIEALLKDHQPVMEELLNGMIDKKATVSAEETVFWKAVAEAVIITDIQTSLKGGFEQLCNDRKCHYRFNGKDYYSGKRDDTNLGHLGRDMIADRLKALDRAGAEALRARLLDAFKGQRYMLSEIIIFADEENALPLRVVDKYAMQNKEELVHSFYTEEPATYHGGKAYIIKWFNRYMIDALADALALDKTERPKKL